MLVLHHHQRAGPQVALPLARRYREDRARELGARICRFFITDDNFARNREWEAIFDRLAKLREVDKIPLGLMIQVDTMCHKIPRFIEKAKRAGVTRVFIGLENINPDNLVGAEEEAEQDHRYRKMLLAWKEQGIFIYAGYILGFPGDTPESIRRDIEIIQRELPLDLLEFFISRRCPAPRTTRCCGSKGVDMDRRPQQVRSRARGHRSPDDEPAGTGARSMRRRGSSTTRREHIETLLRRARRDQRAAS